MKKWSRTCSCIHPVFILGFVCTQVRHQANWQSRGQDGDLFNEARGERESPDNKQTKHGYMFGVAMWQAVIMMKSPRATLRMCCSQTAERNSSQWRSLHPESKWYWNMDCSTWNWAGRIITLQLTAEDSMLFTIWVLFSTKLKQRRLEAKVEMLDCPNK